MKLNKKQIEDVELLERVHEEFRAKRFSNEFSVEMTKAWAILQNQKVQK